MENAAPALMDSTALKFLIQIGISLGLGIITSLIYIFTSPGKKISVNFAITMVVLPAVTAVVISMIDKDIAKAISIGGIFAIVRFRSVPGNSRDILYVFLSMTAGLAVGINKYIVALLTTVILGIVFIILYLIVKNRKVVESKTLKITIPEDLNFKNAFDDIFEKYLDNYTMLNAKTQAMGSLYVLTYEVRPKKNMDQKVFLDELRTRNGNLNILYGQMEDYAPLAL